MSLCTVEEVVMLLSLSRLRPDISEGERKAADLRLIELHTYAVNIGDIMVEISIAFNTLSCGIRLAAALALESLITERAWRESNNFSDKSCALSKILNFLRSDIYSASISLDGVSAMERRVHNSLCCSLCRVISFEYPATHWETFVDECVTSIVTSEHQQQNQQLSNGKLLLFYQSIILQLSEICSVNTSLWWNMSNLVIRRLMEWATISNNINNTLFFYNLDSEVLMFCFRVILNLMRRRPRLTDITSEVDRPTNAFIFSDLFRQFIQNRLETYLTTLDTRDLQLEFLKECNFLLEIARFLLHNIEFASLVFHFSICLLKRCQSTYITSSTNNNDDDNETVIKCVDCALECLVSVLQTFPEVSRQYDNEQVLSTLLSYMSINNNNIDYGDEVVLLQALQEDCVVPLGCIGGDTIANAGAVLELLLEANYQQIGAMLDSLCNYINTLNQSSSVNFTLIEGRQHWKACTTALRCVCRVCEEMEVSLTDSLPDATGRLLSPLARLLSLLIPNQEENIQGQISDIFAAAELVELLAICLQRAEKESVCCAFLSILDDIFNRCSSTSIDNIVNYINNSIKEEKGTMVLRSVIVYAVHRLISTCASTVSPCQQSDAERWIRRSLIIISCGSPLTVYCGAHAVQTLLRLIPPGSVPMREDTPLLLQTALDNACRRCDIPDAASLLAGLLWGLCSHISGNCNITLELLNLFITSHCTLGAPHRTELLRSLTEYILRLSRMSLQYQDNQQQQKEEKEQNVNIKLDTFSCIKCLAMQLELCFSTVLQFAISDSPHDEATTRLLSCTIATVAVCDHNNYISGEHIGTALTELLRSAINEGHSSTTLSTITAAMDAVALVWPTLLDTDMTSTVSLLFEINSTSNNDNNNFLLKKGFHYVGCCLLPALSCVRHPELFLHHLGLSIQEKKVTIIGIEHKNHAWSTMFGIWSSITPFADHFAVMYFLAAWCRLLSHFIAIRTNNNNITDTNFNSLAIPLQGCIVYSLPSLHVKKLPVRRVVDCTLIQCMALGLALLLKRWRRSSRTRLLDTEVLTPLAINRRFELLACCSVHDAGIDALLSMSPVEAAEWLLGIMAANSYNQEVESALQFASES